MRKIILTLLLSGFGLYAMGQQSGLISNQIPLMKLNKVTGAPQGHPIGKTNSGSPITQWYDILDEALGNGSETYNTYAFDIFSDSTAKILYNTNGVLSSSYCTLQDVGEIFDPQFQSYNNPVSLYTTYTIDSVALAYLYDYVPEKDTVAPLSQNPDGLVHDTLIFQFYTIKTGGVDTGAYAPPNTQTYATAQYNYKTNLGLATTGQTVRYILGAKDSVTVVPQGTNQPFIAVKVVNNNGTPGISVSDDTRPKYGYNRDLFAYTVSYRPGFKWKVGDTIDQNGTSTPIAHPHSHFRIFEAQNTAKDMPANIYEMGLQISSYSLDVSNGVTDTIRGGQRYGKDTKGWPGLYVPGTAWISYDEVNYSQFHLNSTNDAAINYTVGDPAGYILGNVYPNPASGTAKLDFALGNPEQVKITLYDMLGHQIAVVADGQYTSGMHTISFDTDNLKEGVYLYSINAGSFSKTLKFTVAHN